MRDPRVDPEPGDILNDDPPLHPLEVTDVKDGRVLAVRYTLEKGLNRGHWEGTLDSWRKEMADAEVTPRV